VEQVQYRPDAHRVEILAGDASRDGNWGGKSRRAHFAERNAPRREQLIYIRWQSMMARHRNFRWHNRMTSLRQVEANQRNALRSKGPKTEEGKQRSRLNAMRHGLTAETVVESLEDAEDYKAFEATIIADYCAETAVARELVLRLASLLWRLRRATAIETDLLELHAGALRERRACEIQATGMDSETVVHALRSSNQLGQLRRAVNGCRATETENTRNEDQAEGFDRFTQTRRLTYSFLSLASLDSGVFERLNRYEVALWRQAIQIIFTLHPVRQR
jgi:hypothetical protein